MLLSVPPIQSHTENSEPAAARWRGGPAFLANGWLPRAENAHGIFCKWSSMPYVAPLASAHSVGKRPLRARFSMTPQYRSGCFTPDAKYPPRGGRPIDELSKAALHPRTNSAPTPKLRIPIHLFVAHFVAHFVQYEFRTVRDKVNDKVFRPISSTPSVPPAVRITGPAALLA